MAKQSGSPKKQRDEDASDGRSEGRPAESRGPLKRDAHTSQLLERGETPTPEELTDTEVASPSEITVEGGRGTDAASEALDEPSITSGGDR